MSWASDIANKDYSANLHGYETLFDYSLFTIGWTNNIITIIIIAIVIITESVSTLSG